MVCYKARLVAKGYSQVEGVDFNETFALGPKFTTIQCLLTIGAALDLEMHQMDVMTTFLKPYIDATFEREGFTRSHVDHSLYIKQTSKSLLIVIIYVDDLIILASNMDMMKARKFKLEEE